VLEVVLDVDIAIKFDDEWLPKVEKINCHIQILTSGKIGLWNKTWYEHLKDRRQEF
jgi:hypothetical protein